MKTEVENIIREHEYGLISEYILKSRIVDLIEEADDAGDLIIIRNVIKESNIRYPIYESINEIINEKIGD